MTSTIPTVAQLLVAANHPHPGGENITVSIGIVLDSEQVFWGDYPLRIEKAEQVATIERLVDLSTTKIRGQRPMSFRHLLNSIRPIFPTQGKVSIADGVSAAIQQALITTVAATRNLPTIEVIINEYGLAPPDWSQATCPLFLEVSDFSATASRIERMLALRPAGIGYRLTGGRVVEAIGENAEHLQRFVRELGQRADQISGEGGYLAAIYLGLNGALGQLTDDPVRHIGKILGHCVGLQEAAGARRLILEEPILLDDRTAESSNLHRLKDFIRRTPTSLNRSEPTTLVSRDFRLSDDEFTLYSDIQAVHAMSFDLNRTGDIDYFLARLSRSNRTGLESFLWVDEQTTPRWIETAVDIALAFQSMGLIMSLNAGHEANYIDAVRYIAESVIWHNRPLHISEPNNL